MGTQNGSKMFKVEQDFCPKCKCIQCNWHSFTSKPVGQTPFQHETIFGLKFNAREDPKRSISNQLKHIPEIFITLHWPLGTNISIETSQLRQEWFHLEYSNTYYNSTLFPSNVALNTPQEFWLKVTNLVSDRNISDSSYP